MGLSVSIDVIVFYALGLLLLYGLGWLLLVPFRVILRLLFNGLLGGGALMLVNAFGGPFGLSIAINPVTALAAGFLGVPGVIMVLILKAVL